MEKKTENDMDTGVLGFRKPCGHVLTPSTWMQLPKKVNASVSICAAIFL